MEDQHTSEMLGCEQKEQILTNQVNDLQQQISRMIQQRYGLKIFFFSKVYHDFV